MKFRFFTLLAVLVCLAGTAMAVVQKPDKALTPPAQTGLTTETIKVLSAGRERANLKVELALTPQQQERGLMGRKVVPKDSGMLFIFPEMRVAGFWMRGVLVPLDMVFIDQDSRIIKIVSKAKPGDETLISSDWQVRAVLEMAGGQAVARKFQIGDLVLSETADRMVSETRNLTAE
jgi:uncharacterized protein